MSSRAAQAKFLIIFFTRAYIPLTALLQSDFTTTYPNHTHDDPFPPFYLFFFRFILLYTMTGCYSVSFGAFLGCMVEEALAHIYPWVGRHIGYLGFWIATRDGDIFILHTNYTFNI